MARRYATLRGLSSTPGREILYDDGTGERHVTAIRSVRPHRAGARAAPRSDLPRAAGPDRAPRPRRLLRLSPGRAPHARDPQPGAVAERVPGQRGPAHDAHALRPVRLRAAATSSAPADRGDQHARQPERRPPRDRRGPRRRHGSLLLGPGGRPRDELRALSGDADDPPRGAQPRSAHVFGSLHSFENLPMYLRPLQKPYPPLWYMRNPVTAAMEGMHTIIVGSIDGLAVAVPRYRAAWEEHQGSGTLTAQGHEPMIGLVVHLVVAETDDDAMRIAKPAWEKYRWNLAAPRRLEAEKRNLTQFMQTKDGSFGFVGERPKGLPTREMRRDIDDELERFDQGRQGTHPNRMGGVGLAGTPREVLEYMEEYVATGANYFVCSFQWGDISHADAMRSIDLFTTEVMPRYATAASPARA